MTTTAVGARRLQVPGAELYYEVRGSGPVLLMMPGGPADARVFHTIGEHIAHDYTVVTYDPRGLSRSTIDAAIPKTRIIQIFADDVHHLLEATTAEPAFVYGSSGGAVIGMDLVARHGDRLKVFVAHEPPSPALQPNPPEARRAMDEIVATLHAEGLRPAMMKLAAYSRIKMAPRPAPPDPTPEQREAMAQMQGNMEFFLGPYTAAIAHFEPNIAALTDGPCRVVAAVGTDSKGEMAYECGIRLGELLGTEAAVFPGSHGGFQEYPAEFAARLRDELRG